VLDGKDITDIHPSKRNLAMVFQNYALFPHLNVFDNIAFGLQLHGVSKSDIRKRVERTAALLHLEKLLDRKPKQLSGGQRQRVAIGRCIVKAPKLFLFDEPLSNLDAMLRVRMRVELLNLHYETRNTVVYVTHDQVEAMTMADKIVVLQDGRIEQFGRPMLLYEHPVNKFVAGFIGSVRPVLRPRRGFPAQSTSSGRLPCHCGRMFGNRTNRSRSACDPNISSWKTEYRPLRLRES
jgi:multiple sugar transport system ATP-binding protein